MSTFVMPSLGADMESAVLMEWKIKEGDYVTKGQIVAEVETSKGVIEVEIFEDGVVQKLLVEEETECAVGTPLAVIGEANKESEPEQSERVKISPAARKKAKELGLNLEEMTKDQKEIHLSQIKPKEQSSAMPLNEMRQAIARAMSRSNAEIPHYYLSSEINISPALEWLAKLNENRTIQDRILPAALLIRAVVKALIKVPELNGFLKDNEHIVSKEINPGIAIALRKGGLITPALINMGEKNLDVTMRELSDLIFRTRSGKLKSSELTEQTITITNLGDLGVKSVYGVIYPPQVAIIGFGKITNSPWVEDDALCVRKTVSVSIAGDHRTTDGRTGAQFLEELNQLLQKPQELL